MAYDVIPTSKEWKEIVNTKDELSQARKINKYVYDLEHKVSYQEEKIRRLNSELQTMRKQILSLTWVQEAVRMAKSDAYHECNTDWSGFQGGA